MKFDIQKLKTRFTGIPAETKNFLLETVRLLQFVSLIVAYFSVMSLLIPTKIVFLPKNIKEFFANKSLIFYNHLSRIARREKDGLSRIDLIELAIKNMLFKRSRAMITMGGMMIGIGAIVFLVSIGFGAERVVTSRVARLDELQQADVSSQPGSNQRINDETLSKLKEIPDVEHVLPMIASVSKISFNNSETDIPVYGVTKTYLSKSAIQPIRGEIYPQDEIALVLPEEESESEGVVAGVMSENAVLNQPFGQTKVTTQQWVKIRQSASSKAGLAGYMQPSTDISVTRIWGVSYPDNAAGSAGIDDNGRTLGTWYKITAPLWQSGNCEDESCLNGYKRLLDAEGNQVVTTGYFASINVVETGGGQVLGDSIDSATGASVSAQASASAIPGVVVDENGEWTAVASESAQHLAEQKELPPGASKNAVVNTAFLQVLGITIDDAIGTEFKTSFIIPGNLLENANEKIESVPTNYKIVGVVSGDNTPFFYVPFTDLRSLGVTNYSQTKVIVSDKNDLSKVRQQIEALGLTSNSVVDTVRQIEQLFGSIRLILITLGLVALVVAALGMFNTLTVSLLERTREVGLMKALGMKSREVKELFLTESLIMGMIGGIGGIALGLLTGKLLSFGLSAFALSKGAGTLNISYLPISFVLFILFISLLVGITTGIFPARRATRISALNALRYE
jgi:ABC-type antimicrobial peptide transport system permease subunit